MAKYFFADGTAGAYTAQLYIADSSWLWVDGAMGWMDNSADAVAVPVTGGWEVDVEGLEESLTEIFAILDNPLRVGEWTDFL